MTTQTAPVAYSVPEAAAALRLSRTTLYKEARAGRIVFVKVGKRSLITAREMARYLAALERQPGRP